MIFGYIDESGAPGVASRKNDYLVASLVIFKSEETRDKSIEKINSLREKLRLPEDYEFHCSSNSTRPQSEFTKLLSTLDFLFITIAIRKNDFRKTASYVKLSGLMMDEIEKRNIANCTVTQTGCIGVCRLEPIVEVYLPGSEEKITYVKMDAEKAVKIVNDTIVNGKVVNEYTIGAAEDKLGGSSNGFSKRSCACLRWYRLYFLKQPENYR